MLTTDLTEAKYLLRKTLTMKGADLIFNHPWIWEVNRWKELVFAFLSIVDNLPEDKVRDMVNDLEDLDLLDITALSNICRGRDSPDLENRHAQHILELLQEGGLSEADAQMGLTTICEAALGLEEHYSGKVQRYLRNYGELMLGDLVQVFRFSTLGEAEVKRAFTYWLQNVLNMPLSLTDEYVEVFSKDNNTTPEKLFAAADELDMNLALVDDLIQRHVEIERMLAAQTVESTNVGSASKGED